MPKCTWTKPECDELKADLVGRLSAPLAVVAGVTPLAAAPGSASPAPAVAAAPAFAQLAAAPAGAQADAMESKEKLYGWCDVLYSMTRERALAELKPAAPAVATALLAQSGVQAPEQAPSPAREVGVGNPENFAHLLPFHPSGQPEEMFRNRCLDFMNHILERGNYEAAEVEKMMPKCTWTKPECDKLKADLVGRLAAPLAVVAGVTPLAAAPGPGAASPAVAAAPAFVQLAAAPAGAPADAMESKEKLYGWCDVLYSMRRKRALAELKP